MLFNIWNCFWQGSIRLSDITIRREMWCLHHDVWQWQSTLWRVTRAVPCHIFSWTSDNSSITTSHWALSPAGRAERSPTSQYYISLSTQTPTRPTSVEISSFMEVFFFLLNFNFAIQKRFTELSSHNESSFFWESRFHHRTHSLPNDKWIAIDVSVCESNC